MFSSIRQKLAIINILIIAIPLTIINYFAIVNMTESVLSEIEVNTLKTANIVSNISSNNIDNPLIIKQSIKQYIDSQEGRILVLDENGKVFVDSANILENTVIDNKEVRQALNMQEGLGYYQTDKYILQTAVPIFDSIDEEITTHGVVLISTNVDQFFNDIQSFRQQLIVLSIFAAIIAVIVSIVISSHIAKPITLLSNAARKIGKGNLGEVVNINSKDEIGRLSEDFNNMSKELYRIDEGRTQFIGDVSHELKTPLASMKALIDSLLYGEDDISVYKEYLRDMDSEIDRLSHLVNSLLSLTKIEEQGIKRNEFLLEDIIEDTVKILRPLADKYNVSLSSNIEGHPKVICDADRLKEALINLIDNALKYRDKNKQHNKVEVIGLKQKDIYELIIVDNGIGMRKEEIESIFEKFYRTDMSRSRDTGGAGIGLSIVSRIMKLHGWEIYVESSINEGSSIRIIIPKTSLMTSL